jgi:hypothetical protein
VDLPTKLVKIGRRAFKGCSSLASIILPIGVGIIGFDAFADCTSLARIAIPKDLREIEDNDIFGGCDKLTDISFGGTKEKWESILRGQALTLQRSDCTVATPRVAFMNIE